MNNTYNKFNNLLVDVSEIYNKFPYDFKESPKDNCIPFLETRLHHIYRNRLIPSGYRKTIWKACRDTNLDLSWFNVFKQYWTTVLGGRGVWSVQDFFFLKGMYSLSSSNQSSDSEQNKMVISDNEHLRKWQDPLIISKLFHMVNKEYFSHQLLPIELMQKHHKSPRNILEYGCATAPITLSYFEFFRPNPQQKIYITDLEYLPFHYGCYRFRHCKNIVPALLRHEDDFQLNSNVKFDVIFCRAVYEHMNQPLLTSQNFYDLLNPGGLLIFDYVMTDLTIVPDTPMGLDHYQGHVQRSKVLDFFENHFELLEGGLHRDRAITICVLRKI